MAVYLDDRAVFWEGASLAELLASARRELQSQGRVVVEVKLDGRTLPAEELEQCGSDSVGGAEVRLYSADTRSLAIDALEQVRYRLGAARQQQGAAADLLQQDKAVEALQQVAQATEAWLQVQQAVQMAAAMGGINLDALEVDGRPVSELMEGLVAGLRNLKELLTHRDTVALADALAYEWPELTDRWDRLIEVMVDRLEE